MVRKGEYLERAVVIPGEGAPLEGLFHRGAKHPPLLIAPVHPSAGSMETQVVAELAWAVTRSGHATLRFNYRGAGASGGTFDDVTCVIDAKLAAEHLALTVGGPVSLCGIGFGAEVVARLAVAKSRAGEETPGLVLVAPDPERLPPELVELDSEVLLICAGKEPPELRDALLRTAASMQRGKGRLAVIPEADRAFVRGLVELGRVVAEVFSSTGLIDLE